MNNFSYVSIRTPEARMKLAYLTTNILAVLGLLTGIFLQPTSSDQIFLLVIPYVAFIGAAILGFIFLAGAGLGLDVNPHKKEKRSAQSLASIAALILFICILGSINISSISTIIDYDYLLKNGATTQAKITTLDQTKMVKSGYSYWVTYQFTVPSPKEGINTFSKMQSVTVEFYRQLSIGSSINILYNPENPNLSMLEDENLYEQMGFGFILFNAVYFLVFFNIILYKVWKGFFNQITLFILLF